MKRRQRCVLAAAVLQACCLFGYAQVDKIAIPAGTPEDQALTAITNEQDAPEETGHVPGVRAEVLGESSGRGLRRLADFTGVSERGDLPKAMEFGEKALVGSPRNLDIIVSQANIAQQMKDNAKVMQYAVAGRRGLSTRSPSKSKPEGTTDQEFATRIDGGKERGPEFLRVSGSRCLQLHRRRKQRQDPHGLYRALHAGVS